MTSPQAFEVMTEEGRLAARVVANQTNLTTNLRVQILPGQEDFAHRMLSDYGATQPTG